jgi:hypothetical protein
LIHGPESSLQQKMQNDADRNTVQEKLRDGIRRLERCREKKPMSADLAERIICLKE